MGAWFSSIRRTLAGEPTSRQEVRQPAVKRKSSHQRPGLVIITAAGLGVAVACLARIGGPPRIGIDALWLHQHLNEVRVLLASVALAVLVSLAMLCASPQADGRGRFVAGCGGRVGSVLSGSGGNDLSGPCLVSTVMALAAAIGSGGPFALAAARALLRHTDLSPAALCREALLTAGEICVFSNTAVTVVELDSDEGAPAREPASPSEKG